MSWLSDLFGGNKKTDFGAIYPDPPQLRLDDYDLWLKQIDQLIGDWDKIRTGESMFDAVKFIYEPQRAMLEQAYGLGAPGVLAGQNSLGQTDDLFARGGTIPRTLAQMNQTGTLDSGTAGIVRAQLESQMNKDLAGLFGNAKQVQRDDYFNSLDQLRSLYPERFEVRNIPNYLDYFNATNQYNVASQRNAATEADRLQRLGSTNQFMGNLLGMGIDALSGGKAGGVGSNIFSNLFNTGMSTFSGGGASISNTAPSFSGARQTVNPYQSSYQQQPLNYASTGGNMFDPYARGGATPQQASSNVSASAPEMGGGGLDFKKLLQMFARAGSIGSGASFAGA